VADTSTGIRFRSPHATSTSAAAGVTKEVTMINPGQSIIVYEEAEIDENCEPYSAGSMATYLHLSPPPNPQTTTPATSTGIIANALPVIQAVQLEVQISPPYIHNPNASFLLVTNSDTDADVVRTWRSFIEVDLRLELDIWNLSLYGSMEPEDDEDGFSTVLASYAGKSVIILCNNFEYFSRGQRTATDFCEPLKITEEILQDTRIDLILRRDHDLQGTKQWINNVVLPICATDEKFGNVVPTTVRCVADVVESVSNQFHSGSGEQAIHAYIIELAIAGGRRDRKLERRAKKTLQFLARHLPQERFYIKPILRNSDASLVVFRGLSRGAHISARVVNIMGTLTPVDRFGCINALSIEKRLEILSADPDKRTLNAARLSIIYELLRETNRFLETSSWPDKVVPKGADTAFLKLHFKSLHELLSYYEPLRTLPTHAIEALQTVLSATHSQSFLQLSSRVLMPAKHRRTRLRAYLLKCIHIILPCLTSELRERVKGIASTRNTKKDVLEQIGELTGKSGYEIEGIPWLQGITLFRTYAARPSGRRT